MYERLGSGTFAAVFLLPRHTVLKKAHYDSPEARENLIQDYEFLKNINRTLGNNLLIRYTKAHRLTLEPDANWTQHQKQLPSEDQHFSPYFEMQRVGPLPQSLVHKIIHLWCPEALKQLAIKNSVNNTYIARLYLGKEKERARDPNEPAKRFFSMKNFPITIDRARGLGIDILKISSAMGQLLARLHWVTHTDANDIEICLGTGSAPNYGLSQFKEHQLRLIGLGSCHNGQMSTVTLHHHFSTQNNISNHVILQICQIVTSSFSANDNDHGSHTSVIDHVTDEILETYDKGEELVVWVIDFDKAKPIYPDDENLDSEHNHNMYQQLLKAHLMNDPYWPVADKKSELFRHFVKAYMDECYHIEFEHLRQAKASHHGRQFIKLLCEKTNQ